MKKTLLILLVLALALPLAACSSKLDATSSADAQIEPQSAPAAEAREDVPQKIDLDLSELSGTVIYSQVYNMTEAPEDYIGQRIRIRGNFSYFQDPDTKKEYFASVIADATACCAQGIEFVWAGEHVYPRDYPEEDELITVTGTFDTYEEDGYLYLELTDADVTWDA